VGDAQSVPDLPDDIDGFTNCLLWLVATRATALVDLLFTAGLSHPRTSVRAKRGKGTPAVLVMADGHHIPTPALIARLIAAGEMARERGIPAADHPAWAMGLPELIAGLDDAGKALEQGRMTALRTLVARAMNAPPSFKESWITDLAAVCGLSPAEADLLRVSRGYAHEPVNTEVLARVIARTLRSPAAGRGHPGGAPPGRRMLPREPAAFTGRADELRRLLAESDVRVFTIGGLPGIGKTALAVHAAHRLAPRYPDGQYFIALHGHTPGQPAAAPEDALASLLLMDGVAPGQISPGLEPRAALWRSRTAGRKILLVLDDASGPAQVEPLLPGTPGSLVLVTSRSRLTDLAGVRAIPLDTLPPAESAALFTRLADRPVLDAADVARIVDLCGRLPLAIAVLARQLYHHPAWSAASLAAEQAAARDRLSPLANDDPAVSAAFDLSYAGLAEDLRRLLRRLGLFPGSEIEPWAVAALDGTDPAAARRGLNALYDRHLLTETEPGRFRLHDLLRDYAIRLAENDPASERTEAVARLADFYLGAAASAGRLITTGRRRPPLPAPAATGPVAVPEFTDLHTANRWLASERLNLDAMLRLTASVYPAHAVAILAACAFFLGRGHADQGLQLSRTILQTASAIADDALQGWAFLGAAEFQRATGDLRAALASTGQALELFRAAGETAGEADATLHLGWLSYLAGDPQAAARHLSRALELFRSIGDAIGEAHALSHLSQLNYTRSDYQGALAKAELASRIYAEHRLPEGQRGALHQLAVVQQETGDFPAAMSNFTAALDLARLMHDRNGEATERTHLGYLQTLSGQHAESVRNLTAALKALRDVGNKLAEATAHNFLGAAQRRGGDPAAALHSQQEAGRLYRDCGSRPGEANAFLELARAQHELTGDLAQALATTEQAVAIFREVQDPISQAEARNNIGDFHLAAGDPESARNSYRQALALIGDASVPLELARALEGIARTYPPATRPPEVTRQLRQALSLYQRLGSPDGAHAAALLSGESQPA
jgi:tetratricopeptide (TPR) repeat protein